MNLYEHYPKQRLRAQRSIIKSAFHYARISRNAYYPRVQPEVSMQHGKTLTGGIA
jgi:hypothetical protein